MARAMTGAPVEIVEVSPRDGLQNEAKILSTEDKVALITRALDAGVKRIEAVSFVNPKRVPQMADAEAVMAALPRRKGVAYIGLALNERGYRRAVAAGCDEVNYVIAATESFTQRNQGASIAEILAGFRNVSQWAKADCLPCSITISTSFGCPFEGEVAIETLADLVREIGSSDPEEIALADTIGVATPIDVTERFAAARAAAPKARLRAHFHNTRNTAIANVAAAVASGVRVIDASIGGIGGCPFAPAATGNVATEDVVYLLHRMGHPTGLDLDGLIETARWLAGPLEKQAPGMVSRAGGFPRRQGTAIQSS